MAPLRDFCFAFDNGHAATITPCPKSATIGSEPAKFDADEYALNPLRSGYAAAVGDIVIVAVGAYYGRHDRHRRRHVISWRCDDYDAVGHAVAVWTPVSAEPTKPTHLYDIRRCHMGRERARKSLGTER